MPDRPLKLIIMHDRLIETGRENVETVIAAGKLFGFDGVIELSAYRFAIAKRNQPRTVENNLDDWPRRNSARSNAENDEIKRPGSVSCKTVQAIEVLLRECVHSSEPEMWKFLQFILLHLTLKFG